MRAFLRPKLIRSVYHYIKQHFPVSFPVIEEKALINPNLFSQHYLQLPKNIFEQVSNLVREIYRIKETEKYQGKLPRPEDLSSWPKTPSVLSCMDFHYSEKMGLKLIEVNTNASLYIPLKILSQIHLDPDQSLDLEKLFETFEKTFNFKNKPELSILDKEPQREGLYFEFLLFKEWLETLGINTNIVSLENFKNEATSNIYNRLTDFYFDKPESASLKLDYLNKKRVFSPNPREYFLMADKKRLRVLRNDLMANHPELANIIPESLLFSEFESKEEVWSNRKKYFFKPSQSFGSKGVYSGKSISHRAFDDIYSPDFLAQELCPPGRVKLPEGDETKEFKFDLRFFCFQGEIQNWGARLYQGQATNMRTPSGGLAPVEFL